jgi:predicted unusual protein kinase regulating ubiquinone biosynthesis (AarF/ABC1/UbiB family)
MLERYRALIGDDPAVVVPELEPSLTTGNVLAMSYVPGALIETLESAPQDVRDGVMATLIDVVLRELFDWGLMQTDPNFANYRWQAETGRLVLLDFGAARPVRPETARGYHRLLMAGIDGDANEAREAGVAIGFIGEAAVTRHRTLIDKMIGVILAELGRPGPFDFADRAFLNVVREQGMEMAADRATWHLPPAETLFVQRKVSGTALLAARLGAKVDVRSMVEGWRGRSG